MENDEDGFVPLHLACLSQASVEVVDVLLKAHADGEVAFAGWDEEDL